VNRRAFALTRAEQEKCASTIGMTVKAAGPSCKDRGSPATGGADANASPASLVIAIRHGEPRESPQPGSRG